MKNSNHIIPVILSGGIGSRLWPLSQPEKPKQFTIILDGYTLFQHTLLRLKNISYLNAPLIVCNKNYQRLTNSQLKPLNLKSKHFILEPVGRNTAPAIAIAALYTLQKFDDPILLVLPADHAIKNKTNFRNALNTAKKLAEQNLLVTFGIPPDHPETGYGYIKFSQKLTDKAYKIDRFVEKPNLNLARKYLKSGNYWWNSGMFVFKAAVFLKELKNLAPEIFIHCNKAFNAAIKKNQLLQLPNKEFSACPSNSIDYAIMEKIKNAAVVELNAGWSDIGSWLSLWQHAAKDANGNVIIGNATVQNTKNSYIQTTKGKTTVLGLKDCIIIETKEGLLVCHKNISQKY
jgi:mannose-1-phosphate guanylyltransferase